MTVISERDFGKLEATVQAQTATLLRVEQRIGQVMTKDDMSKSINTMQKTLEKMIDGSVTKVRLEPMCLGRFFNAIFMNTLRSTTNTNTKSEKATRGEN